MTYSHTPPDFPVDLPSVESWSALSLRWFNEEHRQILGEGLHQMQIPATAQQIQALLLFAERLLEKNTVMNLTAIKEPAQVLTRHLLDSVSVLCIRDIAPGSQLIDVGTGAGLPGVPVHILRPDLPITLLDSLAKRLRFLEEACADLHPQTLTFLHARAEEGARQEHHRGRYQVVLARAVAALPVLLEWCVPFLKNGGIFICQKGSSALEELQNSQRAIKRLGCRLVEQRSVRIPFSDFEPTLLIFEKIYPTPYEYPRRPGLAAKQPL